MNRIVQWTVGRLSGLLLVAAGAAKLARLDAWRIVAELGWPWLPRPLLLALPWFEVALGLLLLGGAWKRETLATAAATFGAFTLLVAWRTANGEGPCGCLPGGPELPSFIHLTLTMSLAAGCGIAAARFESGNSTRVAFVRGLS